MPAPAHPADQPHRAIARYVNHQHPLIIFSQVIPWHEIQEKLKDIYPQNEDQNHAIRKMAGLVLIQNTSEFNTEDAQLLNWWREDIYWQYFCGEIFHECQLPCTLEEFTQFKEQLGKERIDYLLSFAKYLPKEKKTRKGLLKSLLAKLFSKFS